MLKFCISEDSCIHCPVCSAIYGPNRDAPQWCMQQLDGNCWCPLIVVWGDWNLDHLVIQQEKKAKLPEMQSILDMEHILC